MRLHYDILQNDQPEVVTKSKSSFDDDLFGRGREDDVEERDLDEADLHLHQIDSPSVESTVKKNEGKRKFLRFYPSIIFPCYFARCHERKEGRLS